MEHINFNDAIKNVKTFDTPNKNSTTISSNTHKNENSDFFSFKKNLSNFYDKESDINIKEKNINVNNEKSIYSKNEESKLSSGNFGTKKNTKMTDDENINISNISIFKESDKSQRQSQNIFSSFNNYLYSSSSFDNMDFNYSNNNSIKDNYINNNIKEVSPFILNNENQNIDNHIKYDLNKINNSISILSNNNNLLNNKRSIIQNSKKNISKNSIKFNNIKNSKNDKKSRNKFIVLNNSIFKKELDLLNKKFGKLSLNENIIPIDEEKSKRNIKINNYHHFFPCINDYISIRRAFADITNKNYEEKENKYNIKKFKANMPKNFEIHKRKINIIQFQELFKKSCENHTQKYILNNSGGGCCKRYKNGNIK